MGIGDLTKAERRDIVVDLLNLSMSVEEIVDKYGATPRIIYLVANRAGLNMSLRGRIMKMRAQFTELNRKISIETQKLWDSVDGNI